MNLAKIANGCLNLLPYLMQTVAIFQIFLRKKNNTIQINSHVVQVGMSSMPLQTSAQDEFLLGWCY